jgi:hypothetical protein
LIEKGEYDLAEKYILKCLKALKIELYERMAKNSADRGNFVAANNYAEKIKQIDPQSLYNPISYIKKRKREHAAQMANIEIENKQNQDCVLQ